MGRVVLPDQGRRRRRLLALGADGLTRPSRGPRPARVSRHEHRPPRALDEIRAAWRACVVLGAINAAIPFWLVAWGETRIDSGIAAIAQATVPLFSLLIGLRFLPHEHVGKLRIAGVGLGIVGVGLIAGIAPAGDAGEVVGTFAVILASLFYASAGIYGQLRLSGTTSGPVLATGKCSPQG